MMHSMMNSIYVLSILAFDSAVLVFAFLFNVIPGRWYVWRIEKIQLMLASFSLVTNIVGSVIAIIYDSYLLNIGSLYTYDFHTTVGGFYVILLFCSIYKYISFVKREKKEPRKYIELRDTDYKLTSELNFTLGNQIYMPNVQTYAVTKDEVILFSGARPEKEINAGFICNKLGDKVYECISYCPLEKKHTKKSVINRIHSFSIVFVFMLLPVVVAYLDICKRETGNVNNLYKLFESTVCFGLGSIGCKLFSGTKGFGKYLYILGMIMISSSFVGLLRFFLE